MRVSAYGVSAGKSIPGLMKIVEFAGGHAEESCRRVEKRDGMEYTVFHVMQDSRSEHEGE